MYKIIFPIIFIFISLKAQSIDTKAEQALVMDFVTTELLFEKN